MKTILVMSDTHGNRSLMRAAAVRYADEADTIIHLGDYSGDAEFIKTLTHKKVYAIKGNCDIASSARNEVLIRTGGKKILAVHGHKQCVKQGLDALAAYAAEKGADIALFGHTHVPLEEYRGGVLLYNPGSLGESRGRKPTVGIIKLYEDSIKISTCLI